MAAGLHAQTFDFADATVTVSTAKDWGTGFVGEVSIQNKTSQCLVCWSTRLRMDPVITSIWNAQVVFQICEQLGQWFSGGPHHL